MASTSVIYKSKYVELENTRGVDFALRTLLRDIDAAGREVAVRPLKQTVFLGRIPLWSKTVAYEAFVEGVCIGKEGCVGTTGVSRATVEMAKANLLKSLLNPTIMPTVVRDQADPGCRIFIGTLDQVVRGQHRREITVINDMPAP